MFSMLKTDDKIQNNEKKFKELVLLAERHDVEMDNFLNEIGITPKQAEVYLSDKTNLSDEEREEIQSRKKAMDEKLHRDLENICDPKKFKKALSSLQIGKNWIPVR